MPPLALAKCTGNSDYKVCSDSYKDTNGESVVRSYDTQGNNYEVRSGHRKLPDGAKEVYSKDSDGNEYSVRSGHRKLPNGVNEVYSQDSDGNEYSIRSWCDAGGCHTKDSEGNTCTITKSGAMIGC